MDRGALFHAGYALGRAHILKIVRNGAGQTELKKASQYLTNCPLPQQAKDASHWERQWRRAMADNIRHLIEHTQEKVKLPDQHALNAGINLGWAYETAVGEQIEDVTKVVQNLRNLRAHLVALAPAGMTEEQKEARTENIDAAVNVALAPIANLGNPKHPKPRELPGYRFAIEALGPNCQIFLSS